MRLRTLGSIDLRDDRGQRVAALVAQPKRLGLLIYLAIEAERGFQRRDRLLALFWPELDESRARDALNQAMHHIRKACGADVIVAHGNDEVTIGAHSIACDAVELAAHLRLHDHAAAFASYGGEFLPAFHIDASSEFDAWVESQRRSLRDGAIRAIDAVARERVAANDLPAAIAAWHRLLAIDPANAGATLGLMRALTDTGDRAGALRAAADHETTMARDYEASADSAVVEFAGRIRRESPSSPPPPPPSGPADHGRREAAPPALVPPPEPAARTTRRFGRLARVAAAVVLVVATAFTVWNRSAERPFTVADRALVAGLPELEVDPDLSPDGKLVAYSAGPTGNRRIYVRQVDGGPAVALSDSVDGDHRWPRWSPDQSQILFVSVRGNHGTAYLVPYVGGVPRVAFTADHRGVLTPAWSPDGRYIAYSDQTQLALYALADGTRTTLVSGFNISSPRFSPSGTRVAYSAGDLLSAVMLNLAASSIWVVPTAGGAPVRVTDSTHTNASPAWSPDEGSLLFVSDRAGVRDLYQQRLSRRGAPSGDPVRLTTGLDLFEISVSRDARRAVYSLVRIRSNIWSSPIHPDRPSTLAELRQLTREAEAIEGVDVSPDGKWLVYDSNRGGNLDIYKMPLDGGASVRLTADPAPDHVPQFSPDGHEVAYYSERSGTRRIRVMNADGRDDAAVTTGRIDEATPTWSPTGNAIAFSVGAIGDSLHRLVLVSRRGRGAPWSEGRVLREAPLGEPRWSPDGRWISIVRPGAAELLSATDGTARVLFESARTSPEGGARFVAWGRKADAAYVRTGVGFWAVPVDGRPPRRLLSFAPGRAPRRQEFATDGSRLFFTMDADESDIFTINLR